MKIDSKVAGLGDAWMRMLALATLSRMVPKERHTLYPPAPLVPLASRLFQPYFDVLPDGPADVEFSPYGLRHLIPGLLSGKAYYSSFYWLSRLGRPKTTLKDHLNDISYSVMTKFTALRTPQRQYAHEYQGFMEMQGLQPFQSVTLQGYLSAAPEYLEKITRSVHEFFPATGEINRDVVFPSGTAHQIMPPDFATNFLPHAQFAFHQKDTYAKTFRDAGLETVLFETPEDILKIISQARRVYSTDSFTSHLAQTWQLNTVLFMTQQRSKMVVHPGFPEQQVLHSLASCHPCRSLARLHEHHHCDSDLFYCKTWDMSTYITNASQLIRISAANSG